MNAEELIQLIKKIDSDANELKNKFTNEYSAPVNYVCVFAQSQAEYEQLKAAADVLGHIVKQTDSGPLFALDGIETVSGTLKLLKIRQPDSTRPERGDADFTVSDYKAFKQVYLERPGFSLITRPDMEMIELMQPVYKVRAYFSNPPLIKVLGLE